MIEKTACLFCASRCGALIHIDTGRVVKVEGDPEHPYNQGWMCSRGRASVARRYRLGLHELKGKLEDKPSNRDKGTSRLWGYNIA